MDILVKDAHAKINLSLDVLGRREDGYHLVRMVMYSIGLCDRLTFEKINDSKGEIILLAKDPDSLNPLVTMDENNLIYKAAKKLYEEYGIRDSVRITLEKNIPVAAGLAGGSTDAAATLKGINELFDLGVSVDDLCATGKTLGADIPYCVRGGTMLSEGIGEILTPLPDFPKVHIVLAKPACPVSTAEVYKGIDAYDIRDDERPDTDGLMDALNSEDSLKKISDCMANVLELVTIPLHPEIGEIKKIMEENGAVKAMMSGSGPTVFGIFESGHAAGKAVSSIEASGLAREIFLTS
ncbi:MAG: 4-(cytidine 5'-diphospho)-2-C-methyl-D-erythritol kinase [Eubacterium sp.]|nr:4-(cytidine 5'-diphospho)-2-C-methyl-D-erythritol kinase [Eubacterium sp.]